MKMRGQKWVLSVETSLLKHSQEWNLPWELPRYGDNAWEYYLPLILRETPTNQTSVVVVAQSPSHVWFFATPWTTACQSPLSFMVSWNLLKLTSTESVMPSNHLILCHPLLLLPSIFPSIRVFSNERALHIRWPSTGVSALATVLSMNIQGWFPLGLTGLIPLLSKGLESFQAPQFKSINSSAVYDSLLRSQLCCTTEAWVTQRS